LLGVILRCTRRPPPESN